MNEGDPPILEFKPASAEGDGVIVRKKRAPRECGRCEHKYVWLDEQRRIMECRDCGECLEAFDWIQHLLHHQLWKFSRLEETERVLQDASARLERILKDEANAKARLRKAVRAGGG